MGPVSATLRMQTLTEAALPYPYNAVDVIPLLQHRFMVTIEEGCIAGLGFYVQAVLQPDDTFPAGTAQGFTISPQLQVSLRGCLFDYLLPDPVFPGHANGFAPGNTRNSPSQQRVAQGTLADDRPNPLPSPASGFSRRPAQQRVLSPSNSTGLLNMLSMPTYGL